MQVLIDAYRELSQLSWSSVLVLFGGALLVISAARFLLWLMGMWSRGTTVTQIETTHAHPSVADHEIAMLKETRESLGIREGQAIIVRWRADGRKPLELKLKTTDRYRKQGVFETPNTIALSETVFDKFAEHFSHTIQDVKASIKSGWWPGDHPDPSVRLGFWITFYVTLITAIFSLLIEIFVP